MKTTVTDNTGSFLNGVQRNVSVFLRLVLDDIDKTSTPHTPKRDGTLREEKLKQVLGRKGKIAWLVNHAIFQEVKQYSNYTTPGTGPHFAEDAVMAVVKRSDVHARKAGLA